MALKRFNLHLLSVLLRFNFPPVLLLVNKLHIVLTEEKKMFATLTAGAGPGI